MGKMLERACDHLFGDIIVGNEPGNTQNLTQSVKGKSCKIIGIGDSLYNFAKETGGRELKRGMSVNLDVGE